MTTRQFDRLAVALGWLWIISAVVAGGLLVAGSWRAFYEAFGVAVVASLALHLSMICLQCAEDLDAEERAAQQVFPDSDRKRLI